MVVRYYSENVDILMANTTTELLSEYISMYILDGYHSSKPYQVDTGTTGIKWAIQLTKGKGITNE